MDSRSGMIPDTNQRITDYMTNYIERLKEGEDQLVVELSFKRIDQFFDPGDQSPVRNRDLTDAALFAMITAIIDREPKKSVRIHYQVSCSAGNGRDRIRPS